MNIEHLFTPDGSIKSLTELYSTWNNDSICRKGFRRLCDTKWLSLAWHTCKLTKTFELFDEANHTVDMTEWSPMFEPCFLHTHPILRMTLRQLMDTLVGLEWYVFSDLFDASRRGSSEWMQSVKRLLECVRMRAYYFACHDLDVKIMDAEDYVLTKDEEMTMTLGVVTSANEADYVDYQSDDEEGVTGVIAERYRRRRMRREKVLSERRKMQIKTRLAQLQASLQTTRVQTDKNQDAEETSTDLEPKDLRRINMAFIFTVNTIFHSLDSGLETFRTQWSSIPLHRRMETRYDLGYLRYYLMKRFERMGTFFHVRKNLLCELCCIPSYLTNRYREVGSFAHLEPHDVISIKLGEGFDRRPVNEVGLLMKTPLKTDKHTWLHVNTDVLFYVACEQLGESSGHLFRFLYRTEEEVLTEVQTEPYYIFRIRVSNRWCLHDSVASEPRMLFDSFTRAFMELRIRMKARGDSDEINRICGDPGDEDNFILSKKRLVHYDLSKFDTQLFHEKILLETQDGEEGGEEEEVGG